MARLVAAKSTTVQRVVKAPEDLRECKLTDGGNRFGAAVEQGRQPEAGRLEESPLGTGERTLKIDKLKPVGPILDCGTVGL